MVGGDRVAVRGGRISEREALRDLVARVNDATEQREDSRRGTREFAEAEAARRRYRRILLDDGLFERFIAGDEALRQHGNGKKRVPGAKPEHSRSRS